MSHLGRDSLPSCLHTDSGTGNPLIFTHSECPRVKCAQQSLGCWVLVCLSCPANCLPVSQSPAPSFCASWPSVWAPLCGSVHPCNGVPGCPRFLPAGSLRPPHPEPCGVRALGHDGKSRLLLDILCERPVLPHLLPLHSSVPAQARPLPRPPSPSVRGKLPFRGRAGLP